MMTSNDPASDSPGRPSQALHALQAQLSAEKTLLHKLQAAARENLPPNDGNEKVERALNDESVFHVTRLYFMLDAAGCTTPESMEYFITSHNSHISKFLDAKDFSFTTRSELKDSKFSRNQRISVKDAFGIFGRPALTRREIARFLVDHIRRARCDQAVDTLVAARLLIEKTDDGRGDADRVNSTGHKWLVTDGKIEAAYLASLERLRKDILNIRTNPNISANNNTSESTQ
jgi:hypothetical protein